MKFIIDIHTCILFCFRELVERLHVCNVAVYLVSGGFKSIIIPPADILNIPHENIYANRLKFYYDGNFFFLIKVIRNFNSILDELELLTTSITEYIIIWGC